MDIKLEKDNIYFSGFCILFSNVVVNKPPSSIQDTLVDADTDNPTLTEGTVQLWNPSWIPGGGTHYILGNG